MKPAFSIFGAALAAAILFACSAGESETIRQARVIQDEITSGRAALDSTIDAAILSFNEQLSTMSADSVAMKDSVNMAAFTALQTKVSSLATSKSQLADWAASIKLLPSMEDLAGGTENPFGKDAKDEDILNALKASQEEFNALKSTIESEINK